MANYIEFRCKSSFTLSTGSSTKTWDGTIEYNTTNSDSSGWATWSGTSTITSGSITIDGATIYRILLRGSNNTKLSGNVTNSQWVLDVSRAVDCYGNLENVFDYTTVANGGHPTQASYCCYRLFYANAVLRTPPDLGAINLASYCYQEMFDGCASLEATPVLPATSVPYMGYRFMFHNCTNLVTAFDLPATTLGGYAYSGMFMGCTSLSKSPNIAATTLSNLSCYQMFDNCTSLTTISNLNITHLKAQCFNKMYNRFELKSEPTGDYIYPYRIPASGTAVSDVGSNLVDTSQNTTGYYISSSGVITQSADAQYTALLPVYSGTTYSYSCTSNRSASGTDRIHGYNSSGTWVQQIASKSVTAGQSRYTINMSIPSGIAYVRISYGASDTNPIFEVDWGTDMFKIDGVLNAPILNTTYYVNFIQKEVDEYKVTTTELESIADAIRVKGNTTAPMVYPSGFIAAIRRIPTGGGATISTTQDPAGGEVLTITTTGNVSQLQSKTVTPTSSVQTITPDSGYDGLSEVIVNAAQLEEPQIPLYINLVPLKTVSSGGNLEPYAVTNWFRTYRSSVLRALVDDKEEFLIPQYLPAGGGDFVAGRQAWCGDTVQIEFDELEFSYVYFTGSGTHTIQIDAIEKFKALTRSQTVTTSSNGGHPNGGICAQLISAWDEKPYIYSISQIPSKLYVVVSNNGVNTTYVLPSSLYQGYYGWGELNGDEEPDFTNFPVYIAFGNLNGNSGELYVFTETTSTITILTAIPEYMSASGVYF